MDVSYIGVKINCAVILIELLLRVYWSFFLSQKNYKK